MIIDKIIKNICHLIVEIPGDAETKERIIDVLLDMAVTVKTADEIPQATGHEGGKHDGI